MSSHEVENNNNSNISPSFSPGNTSPDGGLPNEATNISSNHQPDMEQPTPTYTSLEEIAQMPPEEYGSDDAAGEGWNFFDMILRVASIPSQLGEKLMQAEDWLVERAIDEGLLPHAVLRRGIQREFRRRAEEIGSPTFDEAFARKMRFIEDLRKSEIAVHTEAANAQHYEVLPGIMGAALGPRMKYSCCLFETGGETLAEAEEKMLASYVDKLEFKDGMSLIDIGCGWGAAVLYFAERFPKSTVVGFSNSARQQEYIGQKARDKGLTNLMVFKADAVTVHMGENLYDRMISCEMFEHLKNYDLMMAKVARVLKPGGKFLLHIFCHRDTPYHFSDGWMSKHFFTGGTMPSADLMLYFQRGDLKIEKHWWLRGCHYNRTIECWLANFIANKEAVWPHLIEMYGEENAAVWFNRWQVYFLACAEMFKFGGGDVYGVTHLLFKKESI